MDTEYFNNSQNKSCPILCQKRSWKLKLQWLKKVGWLKKIGRHLWTHCFAFFAQILTYQQFFFIKGGLSRQSPPKITNIAHGLSRRSHWSWGLLSDLSSRRGCRSLQLSALWWCSERPKRPERPRWPPCPRWMYPQNGNCKRQLKVFQTCSDMLWQDFKHVLICFDKISNMFWHVLTRFQTCSDMFWHVPMAAENSIPSWSILSKKSRHHFECNIITN